MNSRDVEAAAKRLQGNIHNVKVTSSKTFSAMSGCDLFLKSENRQKTGSFKVRGAFNKLAKLKEEGKTSDDRDAQEHADRQGDGHQRIWR